MWLRPIYTHDFLFFISKISWDDFINSLYTYVLGITFLSWQISDCELFVQNTMQDFMNYQSTLKWSIPGYSWLHCTFSNGYITLLNIHANFQAVRSTHSHVFYFGFTFLFLYSLHFFLIFRSCFSQPKYFPRITLTRSLTQPHRTISVDAIEVEWITAH